MRVLIVKTSSMGDVIHTLPALSDAAKAFPDIRFDWVVEENFAEIPAWHPHVDQVIPLAWRRWRKNLLRMTTLQQWRQFYRQLRATRYDLIIDAQGLVKSALCAALARGVTVGLGWRSAREPLASLLYRRHCRVNFQQHAIHRTRALFSLALGYPLPTDIPDYGIDKTQLLTSPQLPPASYLVFLHGTTWATKHWPEAYWLELAKLAKRHGWQVKLPWGNAIEHERAQRIAAGADNVEVLPRMDLASMARLLAGAQAVAAVDTGLGHLTAALDVPAVSLYGPTDPDLTGALGARQVHLRARFPCAPCFSKVCTYRAAAGSATTSSLYPACFATLPPAAVWESLVLLL